MNTLNEQRDLNRICINNFSKVIVILFHAEWHEHSQTYQKNFNYFLSIQKPPENQVIFAQCDATKAESIGKEFNITQLPTVIFTDTSKKILQQFNNEPPALIFDQLQTFLEQYQIEFEKQKQIMIKKITELISQSPVIIFIKGTPQDPECKFTRQFLEIVKDLQVKFSYYDIIADQDMRNWLRYYNKWPTYPQLYINGELIGGLDKTKELIAQGLLQPKIPVEAKLFDPKERLQKITQENVVILFLEGIASETQEQRTNETVNLLKQSGIKFNCFNTLIDQNLNSFLKQNYKNLPLLFSKGNLVGSLEEIQELSSKQELLQKIPGSEWRLDGVQKLQYLLKNCKILIFIEGIPKECKSDQSKELVEIIQKHKVLFDFYNVLADQEVLVSLKELSNYDTIPQLYIDGGLIGGIDVVKKLDNDGDLIQLFKL